MDKMHDVKQGKLPVIKFPASPYDKTNFVKDKTERKKYLNCKKRSSHVKLPALKSLDLSIKRVENPEIREEIIKSLYLMKQDLQGLKAKNANLRSALKHVVTPRTVKKIEDEGVGVLNKEPEKENYIIIFFDIINFTEKFNRNNVSLEVKTEKLVEFYDRVNTFCEMRNEKIKREYSQQKQKDLLTTDHCRLIKKIGDSLMLGIRLPAQQYVKERVHDACELCRDVFKESEKVKLGDDNINLRCGMAFGEVAISNSHCTNDLYGKSVNFSSRLEKHGKANAIHMPLEMAAYLEAYQPYFSSQITRAKGFNDQKTLILDYQCIAETSDRISEKLPVNNQVPKSCFFSNKTPSGSGNYLMPILTKKTQ